VQNAVIKTAYVMGGYGPNGGSYMAYHVGRILQQHFGYACRIVRLADEDKNPVYAYPDRYDVVNPAFLEGNITQRDILVINPSFSHLEYGFRLPGRKLMYIQGYNTYNVMDGFCDYHVCVSRFVQSYINLVYEFAPPVIPAFIDTNAIPASRPWQDRPANTVLVHGKVYRDAIVQKLASEMRARYPDIECRLVAPARADHFGFLRQLCEYRYLLTLSPCEGFGLVPLEAMACGCAVVGFHGGGGTEFMRDGLNCRVTQYPRIGLVADMLADVLRNPDNAEILALQASKDAQQYNYEVFAQHWIQHLTEALPRG
jgi:hypothetical protein